MNWEHSSHIIDKLLEGKSGAQSSRENTWDILLSATLNTSTISNDQRCSTHSTLLPLDIRGVYELYDVLGTPETETNVLQYPSSRCVPQNSYLFGDWPVEDIPLCIWVYSLPPTPTRWCTIPVLKNNICTIFVHKGMQNLSKILYKICAAYIFVSYPDLIGSKVVFGTSLWIIPGASNVGITFYFF